MASSSVPPPADSDYRLAAGVVVRVLGGLLVLLAALVVVATLLVAVAGLATAVLVAVVVLGVAGVIGAAGVLTRLSVVHLGAETYRVRLGLLARGAGVPEAGWRDVVEAVTTTTPAGLPVVVLKLAGERATTIPVTLLAADREEFVRDLQRHLQHGQGLRPLS
ncbi:hypothetical protein [Nocardioides mangrovi]|uniref:Uncharacterized protein n=1 Tax=Nocardioides mangrovi TaxID=2874580 RepID=A0ABS7UEH2_9ACTN|nr:hypothetical protein [Nocardioides mangrovi]MBZ5739399.1 hypothetical protein [Nocardioides mangrovi]